MAIIPPEYPLELLQIRNALKEVWGTVYTDRQPITGIERCVTGMGLGPERMPAKGWKPFQAGTRWGGYDQTTWFRMTAKVPAEFKGKHVVALIRPALHTHIEGLDTLTEGGDTLAYVNGVPFQGIDRNHEDLQLTQRAKGGESFEIAMECCPSARFDTTHEFGYAHLAVYQPIAWDFYWDCLVPLEAWEEMDPDTTTAKKLFRTLQEAVRMIDLQRKGEKEYFDSLREASAFLVEALKQFPADRDSGTLILTGHSHIDTAWLWPLRETRRKVGRTYSTVLNLMKRYPEYQFSASQPELYEYVKEHFPELWRGIKQRVKDGRWEACGAPWIEQDSNMAGGEAIIRQFLYGNRFFEREFGMRSRTAWLPDAFGYPWTLPQIMAKCGIDCFVTTKIDWSSYTQFPYSLFQWQGADGTKMLAVMPPLNYNGNPCPKDAREQWKRFKQKDRVDELIYPIGWGDGGGGPTAEMLERGKRMKNLAGVPKCEFGFNQDSIDRMRKQADVETLPVYNDELYLELHRGCQTTQARTKRNNRKLEVLLHDTEFLASWAALGGAKYNHKTLWKAWRPVLTNQFHDILPGSSITEVYDQADKDYAAAQESAETVRDRAMKALTDGIDTRGSGTPIVVFNSLSWARTDAVCVEMALPKSGFHVVAPDGSIVHSQRTEDGELLFEAHAVPPLGYAVYRLMKGNAVAPAREPMTASVRFMDNEYLQVEFDELGRFSRVYDKLNDREVLPEGTVANDLQLFDDRPHDHDAWEIDHNFEDKPLDTLRAPEYAEVVELGPVRTVVRFERYTGKSVISQDITMYAAHPRVDVCTWVDWQEKRTLLKTAFPVEVLSPRASFHIQFGAIERPTHRNDAHARARFEVPAHHWADLSEDGYGVSLLNDCKYGYDVKDNVLRLSLLRSSVIPDPHADEGEHEMTWSLYPHADDWRNGTVQQGYQLNTPLLGVRATGHDGTQPVAASLAALDADHIIVETVKQHEDSDALILRVYEAHGRRGETTLTFGPKPKKVAICDMMEEQDKSLKLEGHAVALHFTPYEIKTLKVKFS